MSVKILLIFTAKNRKDLFDIRFYRYSFAQSNTHKIIYEIISESLEVLSKYCSVRLITSYNSLHIVFVWLWVCDMWQHTIFADRADSWSTRYGHHLFAFWHDNYSVVIVWINPNLTNIFIWNCLSSYNVQITF